MKGWLSHHLFPGYSLPLQGISFNLTPDCNLRCSMCWEYRHGGIYAGMKKSERESTLTLSELQGVIDDIAPSHPTVVLWGGEPFLHPHFIAFADYIKRKDLHLQVITNGTFLNRYSEKLVDIGVDRIVISIDGPSTIHDEIRGVPGTFKRIEEGITAIEALRSDWKSKTPKLLVNLTVTGMNCDCLVETVQYLETFSLESLVLTQRWYVTEHIGHRYGEVFQEHFKVLPTSWKGYLADVSDIDCQVLAAQISELRARENRFPIQFVPDIAGEDLWRYYTAPDETFGHNTCLVPWRYTAITHRGDVTPCSDRPDYIVGNIRKTPVSELWNSPPYRLFRKTQKKRGLFPICSRCCQLYTQD